MRLDLMQNIPNWEARLTSKLLEKKANIMNAALHGMGTGAKWGAGLGAAYGAGSAALSDDPDASVVKGALRGGLGGGIMGGMAGGMAGPMSQYAPGMAADAGSLASGTGFPGLGAGLTSKVQPGLKAVRNFMGGHGNAMDTPPEWYKWMKNTPAP